MSAILYYSFQCETTKQLLRLLAASQIQNNIYFACIDKRFNNESDCMVQLDNGETVLLPGSITRFPALVLLNDYSILYGNAINDLIKPQQIKELQEATQHNMEPENYEFTNSQSVTSDTYSFLDESHNQSQLYNYGLAEPENTPSQTSGRQNAAESGKETMETLMSQRDAEIRPLSNNGDRPLPMY